MTSDHNSGEFFAVGTSTVTYTVIDASGNTSICSFTVTVNDDENPSITCSNPIQTCTSLVIYPSSVASDNCGILEVIQTAGLPSGSFFPVGTTVNTFQATDIHGNISICSFDVTVFPTPQLSIQTNNVTCNTLGDGFIDLTVSSGTTPYTYAWDNFQTTEDLVFIPPGIYTVNVTDFHGCTASASATLIEPSSISINTVEANISCYNGDNGSIDLTIEGGIAPYSYAWSNGETTQDVVGLAAGTYVVNVTDNNGCVINYGTNLIQPDSVTIEAIIHDATCNAENGFIEVEVLGGTEPYSYSWSNESTSLNLYDVASGTYTLTVTDMQNCVTRYTGTILSGTNLIAYTMVTDAICYGEPSGEILAIVESGNRPYFYDWSNGDSTAMADSLYVGNYTVVITDSFGCTITLNTTVNQPDSLYISLNSGVYISGTNISTFGNDDGAINAEVYGGTSTYSYVWSTGSTTEDISNLTVGSYNLIVTDQNGCIAMSTLQLTQPGILEMPSGFSPNSDGDNDNFVVHGIEAYPENEITVFNRWGNVVYKVSNYTNEWNGDNMNGEALPDATYFVLVTVFTDENITLKGYVDLRR
jgi:gliding motility-associated-like protein